MAPDISCVKTVIDCPAERVLRSCTSLGTSQPMGPQENPKETPYKQICNTLTLSSLPKHLQERKNLIYQELQAFDIHWELPSNGASEIPEDISYRQVYTTSHSAHFPSFPLMQMKDSCICKVRIPVLASD